MRAAASTRLVGLVAGLCGLGWGQDGPAALVATAASVPLLWGLAPHRAAAGLWEAAYFMAMRPDLSFGAGILR